MSIFGKKPPPEKDEPVAPQPTKAAPPQPAPPPSPPPPRPAADPHRSSLGPGCLLEGEFRGKGSFECRGEFRGTVEVDGEIFIGDEGRAKAQLTAKRIVINGRLEGDAIGGEKVEVGASGHVEGDVRAPAVLFAEGAFFEGNVEMRAARSQKSAETGGDDSQP